MCLIKGLALLYNKLSILVLIICINTIINVILMFIIVKLINNSPIHTYCNRLSQKQSFFKYISFFVYRFNRFNRYLRGINNDSLCTFHQCVSVNLFEHFISQYIIKLIFPLKIFNIVSESPVKTWWHYCYIHFCHGINNVRKFVKPIIYSLRVQFLSFVEMVI